MCGVLIRKKTSSKMTSEGAKFFPKIVLENFWVAGDVIWQLCASLVCTGSCGAFVSTRKKEVYSYPCVMIITGVLKIKTWRQVVFVTFLSPCMKQTQVEGSFLIHFTTFFFLYWKPLQSEGNCAQACCLLSPLRISNLDSGFSSARPSHSISNTTTSPLDSRFI